MYVLAEVSSSRHGFTWGVELGDRNIHPLHQVGKCYPEQNRN